MTAVGIPADPGAASERRAIDTAWASVAVVVPVLVALISKMSAVDLAYHVRLGEVILGQGHIPRADLFTFTSGGGQWIDQQWGAQVLLALAARIDSWAALKVVQALLTGLIFLLTCLSCRRMGAAWRTSSLLTVAALVVGAPSLALRPQLIATVLFAAAAWIAVGRSTHPRSLWALPPLALVCANLHGSFPLIVLVGGLAAAADLIDHAPGARRTVAVAAATAAATLANPFGLSVWTYTYDLSTNDVIRTTIDEWAPASVTRPAGVLLFISFLAVVVYLVRRRERPPMRAVITLGLFVLLALLAQRAIIWWALSAPIVLAGLVGDEARRPTDHVTAAEHDAGAWMARAIVATLMAGVVLLLPWWRSTSARDLLDEAPIGLADATLQLPSGARLLVPQAWGSWFEYAAPQHRVFVDSRIEVSPRSVWADYGEVAFSGAGWKDVLRRWDVDAVVADKEDWELIPYLRKDSGWRVLYEDADGILFVPA